MKNRNKK